MFYRGPHVYQLHHNCHVFTLLPYLTLLRQVLMMQNPVPVTVWHEIFAGVYFCGLAIFLRGGGGGGGGEGLIFAIREDWFFLLGISFCDFQKVHSVIKH